MTTPILYQTLAVHNRWVNERLFGACARLDVADLHGDRGAFFGSIHRTLDHVLWADRAWLARLTGAPVDVPPLGTPLYDDFGRLTAARRRLDGDLCAWADGLTADWLAGDLMWVSLDDHGARTQPRWLLALHLFTHQIHHRGQVATLLSQSGIDIGPTDLPAMDWAVEALQTQGASRPSA